MHNPVPDTIRELSDEQEKWLGTTIDDYYRNTLMKDGMPTFLEYVSFVFKLENVSRALQQQLTRHRIGFSFSIQSLRCVDLPNFAINGNYTNPFPEDSSKHTQYELNMLQIQRTYNYALKSGVPTQDARGLLPLNIHSTITFSCTFRALVDMVNKRLCLKTQDEFRQVAYQIIEQVKLVDARLALYFMKPCDKGRCMMIAENEQQFKEGKLTGVQNTDHVCPTYVKKYKGENNENK
jgi:thymidylate synthase (FAD)